MFGLEFTEQEPFQTIYLHGLIRDEHGQKMSKTKGNVIDPLIVMDELGTDALRFTILVGSTPGKDSNLSVKKVEANRNFANKIWNASRYVIGALEKAPVSPEAAPEWTLADSWIWARLQSLVRDVERLFASYQFGEAGRQIYDFFWSEFADWYLEISKLQLAEGGDRAFYTAQTLVRVLDTSLRLLHPFTPFVTEELWGHLKAAAQEHSEDFAPQGGWEDALIIAHWPEMKPEESWESTKIANFSLVTEIVRSLRNLRAEKKITPGKLIPAMIVAGDNKAVIDSQKMTIAALSHLDLNRFEVVDSMAEKPQDQLSLVVSGVEIFLPLADLVDRDAEKARLQKDLAEAESQATRLQSLLASPFAQKAPPQVVDNERAKLATFEDTVKKLKEQLAALD